MSIWLMILLNVVLASELCPSFTHHHLIVVVLGLSWQLDQQICTGQKVQSRSGSSNIQPNIRVFGCIDGLLSRQGLRNDGMVTHGGVTYGANETWFFAPIRLLELLSGPSTTNTRA